MATYQIQPASSTLNWTGKKVLGLHTGSINLAEGFIEIINNKITGGEIQVDMTSITITDIEDTTTHQQFLAHLLNDDFFSVDKFKRSKIVIETSTVINPNKHELTGKLTIKDITHPITFTTSYEMFTDTFYAMGEIIVDRTLYNIRYGSGKFIQNLGDKLIHDEFVLQFKIVAYKAN